MTDSQTPDEPSGRDQLLAEASLWFARMRGPDAGAYRPEFEKWLGRGAAHLGAYNRAAEIFSMGKFLADPDERFDRSEPAPPRRRWPRHALLTGAALLVLLAIWSATARPVLPGFGGARDIARNKSNTVPAPMRLVTTADHGQSFRLPDGSRVALAGNSDLLVTFTARERALRLARGRGRFDVAHESRLFVVYAGGGSVTAHCTVFDVAVDMRKRVTVRLVRGVVDVALPEKIPTVRRLAPGEELRFAGKEGLATVSRQQGDGVAAAPATPAIADYDDARLSELVADANRHGGPQLSLADPLLADLRVSGRFSTADSVRLAERVAALNDLATDRSDPGRIILRRR